MACEIEDFDEEIDGVEQELPVEPVIVGCRDRTATNYNPNAIINDPCLCEYLECPNIFVITDDGVVSTRVRNPDPSLVNVTIKEECCKEFVVGQPVFWDGDKCRVESFIPEDIPNCPDFRELKYVGDTVVINASPPPKPKPETDFDSIIGLVSNVIGRRSIDFDGTIGILPELLPELKLPDPCDDDDSTIDSDEEIIDIPGFSNLSEECCLYLGEEFGWEFIDGVCYWNPPVESIVEVGISENEIIIDRECYNGNYVDGLCINELTYRGVLYNDLVGIPQKELYNGKPYYKIEIPEETEIYLIWDSNQNRWVFWSEFNIDEGPSGCILHYQDNSDGDPFLGYGSNNTYTRTTFIVDDAPCDLMPSIGEIKSCQLRVEDLEDDIIDEDLEDDIIDEDLEDDEEPTDCCDNINTNLWFYLEKPDSEECEPNEEVTVSLGFYYGNNVSDEVEMSTEVISSFNLTSDGYCNWVNISSQINDYDGQKFKLKLIIEGLNDCCDYNFYVDDISVDCIIEDTIISTTPVKCPGFNLKRMVDNKKSWVYNDGETINRVFAPSDDADIPWRYTNYFEQSGVFERHSNLVLNTKEMELTFNLCSLDNLEEDINIYQLLEYKSNFQSFWVQFIEQFVPATTIFVAGEKWCTTDEKICRTYDECDYENTFELNDLGLINIEGGNEDKEDDLEVGGGSDVIPIDENEDEFDGEPGGDYGNNSGNDGLIVIDNFIGVYIPVEDFIISRPLEPRPVDNVISLQRGFVDYRNRFTEPLKLRTN